MPSKLKRQLEEVRKLLKKEQEITGKSEHKRARPDIESCLSKKNANFSNEKSSYLFEQRLPLICSSGASF